MVKPTRQNGKAISTIRVLRCMSRDELAIRLGISYPYLANIENELKNATAPIMHKIARQLDVPVDALARSPLMSEESISA